MTGPLLLQNSSSITEGTCSSDDTQIQYKPLPQCLYLQLDNCAGENKNRYVFAFLSLLVAKGIFKQIYVGFLMVGHTHEDVDAMFSKFSESMRIKDAYTLPQMMDIFHNSYSGNPYHP